MSWLLADIAFRAPVPPASPNDGGESIGLVVSGMLLAFASVSAVLLRKRNPRATIVATVTVVVAAALAVMIWGRFRSNEHEWQLRRESYDRIVEQYLREQERLRHLPRQDKNEDRF